jgi:hypothetical protein
MAKMNWNRFDRKKIHDFSAFNGPTYDPKPNYIPPRIKAIRAKKIEGLHPCANIYCETFIRRGLLFCTYHAK